MSVRFRYHTYILVGILAASTGLSAEGPTITIPSPVTDTQQQRSGAVAARLSRLQRQKLVQAANSHTQINANALPMNSSQTASWQPVGPLQVGTASYGLVTGRITSIALDPSDATGNRVFVGTDAGGVWSSTNAAATSGSVVFTPLTDTPAAFGNAAVASISIGAVSVQPGGTGVVLAGTGDTNNAADSYLGAGLLRSTDNGSTWQLVQQSSDANYGPYSNHSFIGLGFSGFAWSTANSQLVVAALASSAEAGLMNGVQLPGSVMGLYYSTDAGASWQLSSIQDSTGQEIQGPDMDYSGWNGNAVTAVVWNPIRKCFFAAVRFHGYYQSTDGITWMRLGSQPGSGLTTANCPKDYGTTGNPACPIFRGALAVQPVTGDLFALTVSLTNKDQGLWQDKCQLTSGKCTSNTVTFSQQYSTSSLDQSGVVAAGGFNLVLAAVPSQQDTLLYVGETDLWRCSLAASCTWRNTTNATTCFSGGVALAQHAIAWNASQPTLMYFGNEGGLWRSSDGVAETGSVCAATDASHFTNLNSALGSLAMMVDFAESPTTAGYYLAGLNELGTIAGNTNLWSQVLSGEAGPVAIDPNTPSLWYTESGSGVGIHQCTAGTACYASGFGATAAVGATQTASDAAGMTTPAPFVLDSSDTTEVLVGTCRVWRGKASGAGWSATNAISPMLDGVTQSSCNGNAWIRSLASAPASIPNTEYIYAGMAGVLDGGQTIAGHIFRGWWTGSSATWTDTSKSKVSNDSNGFNPEGFAISSLYADPSDTSGLTVYATVEGFSGNGEYVPTFYRTTDGGASWQNLESNLPNSPATSVVVDPLNPNTVYIALLSGVYSTQSISSCAVAGSNCWTQMGRGLPYAPVTALVARSLGGTYKLTAATYGRGLWTIPLLSSPAPNTTVSLSPSSLTFANVVTGQTSSALPIAVTNTGTTPLTVNSLVVTGDFSETDNCQGNAITAAASCTVQISFSPTVTGTRSGGLSLTGNITGGVVTASLSGVGVLPGALSVRPGSLSFGTVAVGQSAVTQVLNIANTGGAALALSAITIAGNGFVITTNNCGSALPSQSSCTVVVGFSPGASGATTGLVTVQSSASTVTVPLAGTGANPATDTLAPSALSFGGVVVGGVSTAQSVTLTNSGDLSLTSIAVSTTGDFQTTNNCGATLTANTACSVTVSFAPTAATSETGVLTLTDALGTKKVTLSGTGLAPAAFVSTPTTLSFASTQVGLTSASQILTVTNTGGVALLNPTAALNGDFALASTNCNASIAAGGSCTYALNFTPTVTGQRSGTITLTSSSVANPLIVGLSGTGLAPAAFSVTPSALSFASTQVGLTSGVLSIQVANSGGVALLNPTFAIAGEFVQQSSTCGASILAGGGCTVLVVFTPGVVGVRTGTLTMTSISVAGSLIVPLSGTGLAPAAFTASPVSLSFTSTQVGSTSTSLAVTVTNTGGVAMLNPVASITGDFSLQTNNCGASIAAGGACTVTLVFTPSVAGSRIGTLALSSASVASPLTVALSGVGLAPAAYSVTPGTLSFPSTQVGATSTTQSVTVTNSGGVDLLNPTAAVNGDFSATSNNCGSDLPAGVSCTIAVTLSPTLAGIRTGTLSLTSPSVAGATLVSLTGTGLAPAAYSALPSQMTFTATEVGTNSTSMTLTVSNTGGVVLQNPSIALVGDYTLQSSNCGTSISAGGSCTLAIVFAPTVAGSRSGLLTLSSVSVAQPLIVPLFGSGLAQPIFVVTPTALNFAATQMGISSAALAVTITNTGGVAAQNPVATTAGDFAIQTSNCGAALAAGANCTISVSFTPIALGARTGTLTVASASAANPAVVGLSGTGLAPAAFSLSPTQLSFPATSIGQTSTSQTLTVMNTGGVVLLNPVVTVAGDFLAQSSTCGAMIAAGGSCSLAIAFSPTAAGARSGSVTVSSTGVSSALASLNGIGLTAASLSVLPQSLSFTSIVVGNTASSQMVTVTNSGGTALTGLTLSVTGDFGITNNTCGATLAGGSSCTVRVSFSPSAAGIRSGTLTMLPSAVVVPLSGVGLSAAALSVSPQGLVFVSTVISSSASAQTVTVTNTGGATLTGMSLTVTGDFTLSSTSCGSTLAGGASCTVAIGFTPTAAGSRSGTLTVNGVSTTATVTLSGTGVTPALMSASPQNLGFDGTLVGVTTSAEGVTVTNIGGAPITALALAISGDYAIPSSTCGTTLASGASCSVAVSFTPTVAGVRSGSLSLNSATTPTVVTLTGVGLTPAALSVSPSALSFGSALIGTSTTAQLVTITNTGGAILAGMTLSISGDFSITSSNCGISLAGGASCTVAVSFTPTQAGSRSGALYVASTASTQTVSLTGVGLTPAALNVAPQSLSFSSQQIGTSSSVQTIVVTNTGSASLSGLNLVTSGEYSVSSSTCGTNLAGGASCNLFVVFTPTGSGIRAGSLSLMSTAPTVVVPLSGIGLVAASLTVSPLSMSFGSVVLGTSSSAQTLTMTNPGGEPLMGISITASGDYAISNNTCTAMLAGGSSCTVAIAFTPTALGSRTGSLSVSSATGGSTVTLSGTGIAAASLVVAPLSLDFGSVLLGATSTSQTVTLSNTGGVVLPNLTIAIAGDFAIINSTCGASLAAASDCAVSVSFTPQVSGQRSGTLTITDGSPSTSTSIALGGSGIVNGSFKLSAQSLSFGQVAVGTSSSTQQVTVTNSGGLPITGIAVTIASPFVLTANSCGTALAAGASCTLSMEYSPAVASASSGTVQIAATSPAINASVALTGAGIDFTLVPSGTNAATILSGQTAAYALNLTPMGGLTGNFAFTCTGAPSNATCTLNPNPVNIIGSNSASIGVVVATGLSANAPVPQMLPSRRVIFACLLLLGGLPGYLLRRTRKMQRGKMHLFALVLLAMVPALGLGCGVSAKGGSGGSTPGGGSITPLGTYTLTVTASSSGITHSTALQLVVN